ncbi:MAG: hypothetical protein R3E79_24330 [Caldilineaceae bacterium]
MLGARIGQEVRSNRGQVIGQYIQHYHPPEGATPPDEGTIGGYLVRVVEAYEEQWGRRLAEEFGQWGQDGLAPAALEGALRRLWGGPFYVQPLQSMYREERELRALVDSYIERRQQQGIGRAAIALLAAPGVGKSSALEWLQARVAQDCLRTVEAGQQVQGAWIPLLISLGDLNPEQYFLDLVRAAFSRYAPRSITLAEAHKLLDDYRCLVLLDDLDKIAYGRAQGGISMTRQFIDTYATNQFVISCRQTSYFDQLGPLESFHLKELRDEEVMGILHLALGERYNALEVTPAFLTPARNRGMLEMILKSKASGVQSAAQQRTWSRGYLLRQMARGLLGVERPGEARFGSDLLEAVEELLERLAHQMHCDRTYRYTEREVTAVLYPLMEEWHEPFNWRQIAQVLRQTGIMERDERRQWRFHSRPLQAYFVAAAIEQTPELIQLLLDGVSDYWWREPLEVLVGLAATNLNDLFFHLIDRDPEVVLYCLPFTGRPLDRSVTNALTDALVERIGYERADGRARLLQRLCDSPFPPAPEILWRLLYAEKKSVVIAVIAQALATALLPASDEPHVYESDVDEEEIPQDEAVAQVIGAWRRHIGITAQLSGPGLNDEERVALTTTLTAIEAQLYEWLHPGRGRYNKLVRGMAAIALGFIGHEQARTVLLAQIQNRRLNRFVAWCVTERLTQVKTETLAEAIALEKRCWGCIARVASISGSMRSICWAGWGAMYRRRTSSDRKRWRSYFGRCKV